MQARERPDEARQMVAAGQDPSEARQAEKAAFMRNSPTRRLDVLGDVLLDLQRAQQHAASYLLRALSRKDPEPGLERQLHRLRKACRKLGVLMPEEVGALIVLDRRFSGKDS